MLDLHTHSFPASFFADLHLVAMECCPTHNWEKNRKTFFDFLSSGLGINVSFFRLRQFGEVKAGLGSPEAGVEIGIW